MSFHTANPSGSSHLFPCLVEQTICLLQTSSAAVGLRPPRGGSACSKPTALVANSRSPCADELRSGACLPLCNPAFCSVTASGPFPRPAALGLLLRFSAPSGSWFLPQQVCEPPAESAAQTSCGPLPECRPSALGSRAHSLGSAQGDPSNNG